MILYDFPIRTSIYRGLSIATFDDRSVYFMNIQRIVPKWVDADRWWSVSRFQLQNAYRLAQRPWSTPKRKSFATIFPFSFCGAWVRVESLRTPNPQILVTVKSPKRNGFHGKSILSMDLCWQGTFSVRFLAQVDNACSRQPNKSERGPKGPSRSTEGARKMGALPINTNWMHGFVCRNNYGRWIKKRYEKMDLFCRMEKSPETQLCFVWTSRLKGAEWIWTLKKEIAVELNGFMYLVVTSRLNQYRLIGDWKI
jgi:hypothetical protein